MVKGKCVIYNRRLEGLNTRSSPKVKSIPPWYCLGKIPSPSRKAQAPTSQTCVNLPSGSAYSHYANSQKLIMQKNDYA